MGKIETGILVLIIGMLTVFAVLTILWGVLEYMKKLFGKSAEKKAGKAQSEVLVTDKTIAENSQAVSNQEMDEEELIAVFAAVIAASQNTSTYNLNIKSYRRVHQGMPEWNRVSRIENNDNSF